MLPAKTLSFIVVPQRPAPLEQRDAARYNNAAPVGVQLLVRPEPYSYKSAMICPWTIVRTFS